MLNQELNQEKTPIKHFKHENQNHHHINERFQIALREAYERMKGLSVERNENVG